MAGPDDARCDGVPHRQDAGRERQLAGHPIGSFTLPMGFILGIGLAVGLLVLIRSTRYGFEMRVMGDSPQAANYSGIRTKRKIVSVMAISGGIAGIAGSSQIGDFGHVLDPRGLEQAQYGYTGIVVAALALYNPLAVVLVSLFIGGLTNAGFALEGPSFPTGLVGTMEGIILFTVLGGEILARYRIGTASPARFPVAGAAGAGPGWRHELEHRHRRRGVGYRFWHPARARGPRASCWRSAPACSTSASRA